MALVLLAAPWLIGAASFQAGTPCDPSSACFDVRLSLTGLVGDFYLDGGLVAAGVNAARLVTTPGVPHLIEVKNVQDPTTPGFGDLFIYADQSIVQQTNPGWIWRVIFYPRQTYIKGTFRYICEPLGRKATDSVACRPTIDGLTQPDVPAGSGTAYTLTPGAHAVHTDLVGDQAQNWSTTVREDTISVAAGRTSWMTFSFTLKGLLKISLLPAGLVGDLYVDGILFAPQSVAAELFTTPQVAHTVEARNVVDPAANGRYRFDDVTATTFTYAGGTRSVYLRPAKVWLTGTLSFICQLNRKTPADDAQCLVSLNGAQLGAVPAGTRATFDLAIGTHSLEVSVVGASASRWDGPFTTSISIAGGGKSFYTARFNLRPSVSPPVSPAPVPQPAPAPPPTGNPPPGGSAGLFELGGQVAGFDNPGLMRYAGMLWVKRQVRWSPGATADAGLIQDAHAKGFKILLSVLGHPADIAGGANFDDYARFAGDLARLGADGIEVWNEMNIDREWPAGEIDPARYTDLLRRAYQQVKANNPYTLVISGAPAPTGAEGAFGRARVWNDDAYVAGMAAAGAANYMDCIGAHYNEGIISPLLTSGDPRDPYYTRYYGGMVVTYFYAFGGARKICFTELGYLTPEGYGPLHPAFGWAGNTTVAQQAQWLAEAVNLARSSRSVRMIIVFNVDFTSYGDDPQAGYAIIRPGGVCPACDALRAVTGGR